MDFTCHSFLCRHRSSPCCWRCPQEEPEPCPSWQCPAQQCQVHPGRAMPIPAVLFPPGSAMPILAVPCPSQQSHAHPGSAAPVPAVSCPGDTALAAQHPAQPRGTQGCGSTMRRQNSAIFFQITLPYKINKGLLSSIAGLMIVGHHLREWRC